MTLKTIDLPENVFALTAIYVNQDDKPKSPTIYLASPTNLYCFRNGAISHVTNVPPIPVSQDEMTAWESYQSDRKLEHLVEKLRACRRLTLTARSLLKEPSVDVKAEMAERISTIDQLDQEAVKPSVLLLILFS